jgi:hypothetical protein
MPSALTIPGVQIRTVFEPAPVLPGATGILGVVGVTDRGPLAPTSFGSFDEFLSIFGPGSRHTLPEVRQAFTNGVSLCVVARTAPGGPAKKASTVLLDEDGDQVIRFDARAEGAWGNRISVRVNPVRTLSGRGVRYVDVEVLLDGAVREAWPGLVMDPANPNDLFAVINDRSALITAIDPAFETMPPKPIQLTPLTPSATSRASETTLKHGPDDVVRVVAKDAGPGGDRIGVGVVEARAGLTFQGADHAPSFQVVARETGDAGTAIKAAIAADPADAAKRVLRIVPESPATARETSFGSVKELVTAMAADPDVEVVSLGKGLPEVADARALRARVDVVTRMEGRDTTIHPAVDSLAALAAIADDPLVTFATIGAAKALPDGGQARFLAGGSAAGQRVLSLPGEGGPAPLVALLAIAPPDKVVQVKLDTALAEDGVAAVDLTVFDGEKAVERYPGVTMDPDHPRYLPRAVAGSAYIRAEDLFIPVNTTSLPAAIDSPRSLSGGTSPDVEAYQDALDRLEMAEEVDLVIASVANQLEDPAAIRSVHQRVVAHCTKMADVARNRIGLGSVTPDEALDPALILDHADDVRSDHFVLTTPAGSEGAFAGMLGLQEYFQAPTFKTVSALGVPAGQYSDAQLTRLVQGNVVVINERRGLGIIVIKGILTSGRQINVQRTANKAVRDVKAICQKYIGLLNNDGARIALKQQIIAALSVMERDGALVPSTDGTSPAFGVAVFSTQADFANGIVNVDIAVRPVRAIDYIYGRILVQN